MKIWTGRGGQKGVRNRGKSANNDGKTERPPRTKLGEKQRIRHKMQKRERRRIKKSTSSENDSRIKQEVNRGEE
jgi:hypothetical protein